MAHSTAFLNAYVQLLARLWHELELLCGLLESNAGADEVQTRAQILRLECFLVQQSVERASLALSSEQAATIRETIYSLSGSLDCIGAEGGTAIVAIERVQNEMFDQVQWRLTALNQPHRRAG